jgi:uncharacterized repeat protein (TIGR03803 family)
MTEVPSLFAFVLGRSRKEGSVGTFSVTKIFCASLFCIATVIASPAQTFTTLLDFNSNGIFPLFESLIQGTDGNFYGTTYAGGNNSSLCASGCGTIFKITPEGTLTTLHSFNETDGGGPAVGLLQTPNGYFYGTTAYGGANGDGTVFKMTSDGTLTTLRSFDGPDGESPYGALVQGANGSLYGTTLFGGSNNTCVNGCGTVFKITPTGALTTLYNFCSQTNCADGDTPFAGLLLATDGSFYGTTYNGGNDSCESGCGTIFKITPGGTLTTLYKFCSQANCTDGINPSDALMQGANGNLYGTARYVGTNGGGSVFEFTAGGTLTTVYSFDGSNGDTPIAGVVQATDGNFYGTTAGGGTDNAGTIFKVTNQHILTTLHNFDITDGQYPYAGLLQATNGIFYGLTYGGGPTGEGTIFSLSVGLAPFVKTIPISGNIGAAVIILGNNLAGATSVSFNGTVATFKVISASAIKATVPAGATTGFVLVTKPSGTLKSNTKFRVNP